MGTQTIRSIGISVLGSDGGRVWFGSDGFHFASFPNAADSLMAGIRGWFLTVLFSFLSISPHLSFPAL